MTTQTSQKLADALRAAGFDDVAERAEADEFHDFLSPHAFPQMLLAKILTDYANTSVPEQRSNARLLRRRLMEGEFDASDDEADAWIDSPEGQATFDALIWGKKE